MRASSLLERAKSIASRCDELRFVLTKSSGSSKERGDSEGFC